MRFLKLQVLLLVLAVLAVGALAFDIVLKGRAEAELGDEVVRRVPGTRGVKAEISSFPFVGRLLLSGQVAKVVVTAQHAGAGDVVALSDIRVEVEGVEMDTGEAMDGRAVVRSIRRGSVRADVRQDQVNARLPRAYRVELQAGSAEVSGPAASQAQLVTTPDGTVQLRIAGRPLVDIAFPKTELLPCSPTATFVTGALRLACTFDQVPKLLLDLGRR